MIHTYRILEMHQKVIKYCNKILKLNQNSADALSIKGWSLKYLGIENEGRECITKARDLYNKSHEIKTSVTYLASIGIASFNSDKYEEAIECYNKALKINPTDAVVLNNKGYALAMVVRNSEALECCNKALEISPNYVSALGGVKSLVLLRLGRKL